jgi:hypothetical protein
VFLGIYLLYMQYYIIDPTLQNKPHFFNALSDVIKHLEGLVARKYKKTRAQYMQHFIDLGYGYDDPSHKTFLDVLSKDHNIGVVKGGRLVKCNIHDVQQYSRYRTEMGD